MAFRKTQPALLVALALQQLSHSAQAQIAAAAPAPAAQPQAAAQQLPEVRVHGQPAAADYAPGVATVGAKTLAPLRDIPQSVTVVNRAVLDAQGAASLQEALRNVPGITIGGAEGGQIGNNINLRGFTARTDIYLDGARDRGQYYRDTYYLDSVEVLKGPSSMLFGRGATGGIVNQVRKQAVLADRNEITATVGSHGYARATGAFNRRLSDSAALRLDLMGQDVKSSRDVISNQDYGIAPSLRFGIGTPSEITLSALIAHNHDMPDYGVLAVNGHPAEVGRDTFYGLRDDRTVQDVTILSARVEHKISPKLTLRNQTQYGRYRTDARETYPNNVGTVSGGVFTALPTASAGNHTSLPYSRLFLRLASHDRKLEDSTLDNQTDLIAKFDSGAVAHTLIAGAQIGRDSYRSQASSRNNLPLVPLLNPPYGATPATSSTAGGNLAQADATALAAYVNDTLELNRQWKLVGGLRWDRFKADLSNTVSTATPPLYAAEQTVHFASVRSGVIYQPNEAQSYYASYGTSFNPSLEQLTVVSGQQNVAPERSRSFELGAKWDVLDGKLSLNSALFDIEKTNVRSLVSSGVYQLDGDVRVTGFEFGAAGRLTRRWQVAAGYTHLNARIERASALDGTQGKTLANTPRDSATLWSAYNLTPQWEVGGGFSALSRRYTSNTNVVSVPGYTRWDATLAYHQATYDIRLNLLNLGDRRYFDALIPSDGGRAVPGAGRSAQVTLAYRF